MKTTHHSELPHIHRGASGQNDRPDQHIAPRKWRGLLTGLAAAAGLAVSVSAFAQQLINVDYLDNAAGRGPSAGTLAVYNGQGVLGGPSDTYWNAYTDTNTSLSGLLDSTGVATTVGITLAGGSPWSDMSGGNDPATTYLLADYYFGATITVTLTGLDPNATYEVVAYSAGDQTGQGGIFAGALTGSSSASTRSSLVQNGNYVEDVPVGPNSAGTITFSVLPYGTQGSAYFDGLQIQKLVPNLYAPIVTNAPASQVVRQGRSVTFSVGVDSGSEVPYYQWYFGALPIAGGTNAVLTFTNLTGAQAGNYSAVVTNMSGSVTSSVSLLVDTTTTTSLFIGGDAGQGLDLGGSGFEIAEYYGPQDDGALPVQNSSLTYNANRFTSSYYGETGPLAPNFGSDQSDQNLSVIANNNAESTDYLVPMTLSVPTVAGESYKLQLLLHDNFNTGAGRQKLSIVIGSEVVEPALDLAALGAGGGNPEGVVISYYFTGTGNLLPISITNSVDQTGYAELNALTLESLPGTPQLPYFVLSPQNQTNVQGSTATFSALAGGSIPPFAYQWYFGTNLLAGATNSTYSFSNVRLASAGTYYVVASNTAGAVTNAATLAVNNNSGIQLSWGPAPGQGMNLQGNVALAEYYYSPITSLASMPIGSALFVPSTRAGTAGAYLSGVANFGNNLDQQNLAYISAHSVGGNPNFTFGTTAGDSYYLQLIFHDGYFTTAGSRVFSVQAISSLGITNVLATGLDLASLHACTTTATNVVVWFSFTGDGGPMNIQLSPTANAGCISALVLQDLTAPLAPVLLSSLSTQGAYLGDTVTIISHVNGSGLSYQWEQESNGVYNSISWATNYSLTITNITLAGFTNYVVVVTNALGSVSSTGALQYLAFNPHALIGHWLSGSQSLADSSGYAPAGTHDGVIATGTGNSPAIGATPVWAADVPPGFSGSALDLSTVASTFVMISNSASSDANYWPTFDRSMTNGYTIAFWAKGWPVNNYGVFVGKRGETSGSTSAGYQFRRSSSGKVAPSIVQYGTATAGEQTSWLKTTNDTAHWHHYAATWDSASGARKLYVDNVLAVSLIGDTGLLTTYIASHLGIGARQDNLSGGWGNFSQIKMFDVRIYGYALAASDIQNLNQEPSYNPFSVVTGPAVGQGLDLQENFVLAEHYGGGTNSFVIGGAVFQGVTNRINGTATALNKPNFGSNSDQQNLATISSELQYGVTNFTIPTTVGDQYKLQLIFHDNTYTNAGRREFAVQIGTNDITLIATNAQLAALQAMLDAGAFGACVTNPVDLVLPYTFTATSTTLLIKMVSIRDNPILSALTLADLSTPLTAPVVLVQVNSVTNGPGSTVQLLADVAGAQVTYQWQKLVNGVYTVLTDGGKISGSTNNVLTITNLASGDATSYKVVVSNSAGSASSIGTVTETMPSLAMGQATGGHFTLTWSTGAVLQSTTNLTGNSWIIESSNSPDIIVPAGSGNKFYRVFYP